MTVYAYPRQSRQPAGWWPGGVGTRRCRDFPMFGRSTTPTPCRLRFDRSGATPSLAARSAVRRNSRSGSSIRLVRSPACCSVTRSGSNRPPSRRPFLRGRRRGGFGFRLGRDLLARLAPDQWEEVGAAVDAIVPLIQICEMRLSEWRSRRIEEITADNAFNGGVVVGTAFEAWRSLDLATHHVTLSVDGERKGEGTGALVLGHPLIALTWLANEMSRRGDGLRAGELVAAGTCTGLHFVQAGQHGRGRFRCRQNWAR